MVAHRQKVDRRVGSHHVKHHSLGAHRVVSGGPSVAIDHATTCCRCFQHHSTTGTDINARVDRRHCQRLDVSHRHIRHRVGLTSTIGALRVYAMRTVSKVIVGHPCRDDVYIISKITIRIVYICIVRRQSGHRNLTIIGSMTGHPLHRNHLHFHDGLLGVHLYIVVGSHIHRAVHHAHIRLGRGIHVRSIAIGIDTASRAAGDNLADNLISTQQGAVICCYHIATRNLGSNLIASPSSAILHLHRHRATVYSKSVLASVRFVLFVGGHHNHLRGAR